MGAILEQRENSNNLIKKASEQVKLFFKAGSHFFCKELVHSYDCRKIKWTYSWVATKFCWKEPLELYDKCRNESGKQKEKNLDFWKKTSQYFIQSGGT